MCGEGQSAHFGTALGRHALVVLAILLADAATAHACGDSRCTQADAREKSIVAAVPGDDPQPTWSYPIPNSGSPPDRLVLTGVREKGRFVPRSATVPAADRSLEPGPYPLDANLLPLFRSRSFGIEERVTVVGEGETVTIHCAAGERPAGVAFGSDRFRLPQAMRGELIAEGRTTAAFSFGIAAAGGDAHERPAAIGREVLASVPSSEWNEGVLGQEFVVSCPKEAASVSISAVRIVPHAQESPAGIATWLWNARVWLDDPGRLAALARRERIADIFLQVPIEDGQVAHAGEMRNLIESLTAAGVSVHAVEGDADMATDEGRANALERARVLASFVKEGVDLSSFQYDIEPYLRPGFAVDPVAGWHGWAKTVNDLSKVLGSRISVVVPFWMLGDPASENALRMVESSISGVTVMAYRTEIPEVERIAEGWLSWGVDRGVLVNIALENGPLPVGIYRTFVRAEKGPVAIDHSANVGFVQMFGAEVTNSYTKPTYSFSHEIEVLPSRISFMGDGATLEAARERLGRNLSAWDSFDGLSVHGLIAPGG